MKKLFAIIAMVGAFTFGAAQSMMAQGEDAPAAGDTSKAAAAQVDTAKAAVDSSAAKADTTASATPAEGADEGGMYKAMKTKFIEGSAGFMSTVAIALVLGLAFCIERVIYLTLAEVNYTKLIDGIQKKVDANDIEGAKTLCRNTRGPVASICYQGLMRFEQGVDEVERSVTAYGSVQATYLEKGCSWITLFIAMAPSLGFLGTVIGMVMAFDDIQKAGDISPTIVAGGMKVALITTIFGIIVALILQLFYNYILSKIEAITANMEEATISLLDMCTKYSLKK